MALRGLKRKDIIKKSSYYVWFLGAKESRGLRGDEYIRPAVHNLVDRECEVEPLKVTLQVSSKGLKIIQNVHCGGSGTGSGAGGGGSKNKSDMVKHFIPDHSITCVTQGSEPNDDIVACILLIYNPVSKCPVHVHAYRCDSVETATVLRQQLQALVEHPDNQRKFAELEVHLQAKGLLPPKKAVGVATSDGRSVRTESDSSGGGSTSDKDIYVLDERMNNLYDSLAAELREKLNNNKNNGPILLPPRDYDTVHRMKGKFDGIEDRRCLQKVIVGTNVKGRLKQKEPVTSARSPDSSGKSSGIGSDEAPSSPTHVRGVVVGKDVRLEHNKHLNPVEHSPRTKKNAEEEDEEAEESSSDEEWRANNDPQAIEERDMILVQSPQRFRRSTLVGGGAKTKMRSSSSPPLPSMPPPPPSVPPLLREPWYHDHTEDVDQRMSHYTSESTSAARQQPVQHHAYVPKSVNGYVDKQRKPYSDNEKRIPQRHVEEYSHNDDGNYDNRNRAMSPLQKCHTREEPVPVSQVVDSHNGQMIRGERSRALPHYHHHHQHQTNANMRPSYDRVELTSESEHQQQRGVNRYHDGSDRWAPDSPSHPVVRERHLASPSSPPYSSSPSKNQEYTDVLYQDGYHARPLPRVRRLDSGHSSSMSNNPGGGSSSSHHNSPHRKSHSSINNKGPNYQELPEEKRYPGLDRDTARIQHHYLPTVSTTPHHQMESTKKIGRRNVDPSDSRHVTQHADHRERYNLSPSPPAAYNTSHGLRRTDNGSAGLVTPANRLRGDIPQGTTQGQQQRQSYGTNANDDKRFYRYSSTDVDLTRGGGHRMQQQANGFRF